eukprot:TRINITY_DN3248_c0_g1_i1.p1 TRINITY_DN3248_c0_g1~~TRINITY_DN3248_c0_g1_i1.p1  ORF type:complete len:510 (+),score=111.33 TRINITY_DN3248_c0_g1_i1:146-1531(+)
MMPPPTSRSTESEDLGRRTRDISGSRESTIFSPNVNPRGTSPYTNTANFFETRLKITDCRFGFFFNALLFLSGYSLPWRLHYHNSSIFLRLLENIWTLLIFSIQLFSAVVISIDFYQNSNLRHFFLFSLVMSFPVPIFTLCFNYYFLGTLSYTRLRAPVWNGKFLNVVKSTVYDDPSTSKTLSIKMSLNAVLSFLLTAGFSFIFIFFILVPYLYSNPPFWLWILNLLLCCSLPFFILSISNLLLIIDLSCYITIAKSRYFLHHIKHILFHSSPLFSTPASTVTASSLGSSSESDLTDSPTSIQYSTTQQSWMKKIDYFFCSVIKSETGPLEIMTYTSTVCWVSGWVIMVVTGLKNGGGQGEGFEEIPTWVYVAEIVGVTVLLAWMWVRKVESERVMRRLGRMVRMNEARRKGKEKEKMWWGKGVVGVEEETLDRKLVYGLIGAMVIVDVVFLQQMANDRIY